MQRASLRRVGRLWAVIAAVGGVSGCGDDLPATTIEGTTGNSTGSSSSGTNTGATAVPTSEASDPTVTNGESATASATATSEAELTTDDPTTGATGTTATETTATTDGVNEAPVALVDVYVAKARQVLSRMAADGVLANDFDPDGDPITVIASDPITPGLAALTMPQDGSFTYFPPADLWGNDSFTYKIHDGNAAFASTTVQVKLTPTAIPLWAIADGKRGFVINGAAPDDYSGRAVHHIGDLNKDGLGDLVVASRNAAGNTGRVYVVFGKTTGGEVSLANLTEDEAGFEITGEAAGDLAGTAVSAVGDVNGDGTPDILLGAPGAAIKGKSSGTSYVVFGKPDSAPVFLESVALGQGGFSIEGEATQHFSGRSVKGAGDVNGDGLADMIIGAYGAEPNGVLSGRAYVVFGRGPGKPTQLTAIGLGTGAGFVMNGEAELDFAGSAVAGAGDVNGDGLDDLIVGAYGSDITGDTSGRAYVVFGKSSATPVELSAIASGLGGFAIDGEFPFDQAGAAVGGAGDVNGDGLADLVIGAPLADANSDDTGRSYVVFGKASPAAVQLAEVTLGMGGFAIDGQQVRDYSGFAVDAAGDVNGDGLDDVIIGAYGANPSGDASGRSYVVFGREETSQLLLNGIANGDGGFAIDGEEGDDYSGFACGAAGDADGDGFADVIVGAFGSDAKGDGAGRSYVVLGGDYSNVARNVGGQGPDNLAGTAEAEIFVSGRGDDTITGQGGADIFYCGAGDDTVRLADLEFRRIDGGAGEDTVLLMGAGLTLDLSERPDRDLVSLEVFALADGEHTLVLERRDLLALSRTTHVLTVTGGKGTVEADLTGGTFVDQGEVGGFQVYSDGVTSLRIAATLTKLVSL